MRTKAKGIVVALFAVFFLSSIAFAVDCPIPDTGQTKCYNATTSIPCPSPGEPFYGQDANYAPCNPQSYTTLGGGTMVQDNVTGLIWEVKTDDGSVHDKDNEYRWHEAQDIFISALNTAEFGGYDDWRMPTIKELSTLVNSSISYPGPTINTNYFPNTVSSFYWSSTTNVFYLDYAWGVYFSSGYVSYGSKPLTSYVRAVRAGQSGSFGDFVDNGDGTVTDNTTGLMWEVKTDDGGPRDKDNTYNWQQALSYCESLILGDDIYDDWRLPNRNELQSIVDYSTVDPAINEFFFPATSTSSYWSSTTYNYDPYDAWTVVFNHGYVSNGTKSDKVYVRAVRVGQCDSDGDGILNDGDNNETPGDNPCTGGETVDCDDNCPHHPNGPLRGICTEMIAGNYIVSNGQYCVNDTDCDDGEYCEKEQADHYPQDGNGIGDACDCEGNFDCDGGVTAADVGPFLDDWNKRTIYSNPCTNEDPCTGDFNCSGGVDSGDVGKFLEDWNKRTIYSNPCPACAGGSYQPWCVYPE